MWIFFFFKQKTAYEMIWWTGVQTCALPILELCLGQYQRVGCISVWRRICPLFQGNRISTAYHPPESLYTSRKYAWVVGLNPIIGHWWCQEGHYIYFSGIGYGICIISFYVSIYYNTVIAWALYYFFASWKKEVPWKGCGHAWNTEHCKEFEVAYKSNDTRDRSGAQEFFK